MLCLVGFRLKDKYAPFGRNMSFEKLHSCVTVACGFLFRVAQTTAHLDTVVNVHNKHCFASEQLTTYSL